MQSPTFGEAIGAGMAAVAVLVIAYLSIGHNDTATGALIGIVSAAISFFLRARVLPPAPPAP